MRLLEWRRVFPSPHPPRAVDRAHSTAGIAVPTTMGHALGASIWIYPVAIASCTGGNRGDGHIARVTAAWLHGCATLGVSAHVPRDDSHGIRTVVAAKGLDRRRIVDVWETWWALGDGGRFSLALKLCLSRCDRLLLLASLELARLGPAQEEPQTGTTYRMRFSGFWKRGQLGRW